MPDNSNVSVAVLLPCYNEEVTIGKVVRDFKAALPNADVHAYEDAGHYVLEDKHEILVPLIRDFLDRHPLT